MILTTVTVAIECVYLFEITAVNFDIEHDDADDESTKDISEARYDTLGEAMDAVRAITPSIAVRLEEQSGRNGLYLNVSRIILVNNVEVELQDVCAVEWFGADCKEPEFYY